MFYQKDSQGKVKSKSEKTELRNDMEPKGEDGNKKLRKKELETQTEYRHVTKN